MSLYRNIHAKRQRIKQGSGEKMLNKNNKNAPTDAQFEKAKLTAKKKKKNRILNYT
tara:strand:- start:1535 stop:1702 length:168 start_codon:yes stop_codon:yes gene_type:complete